MLSTRRCTTETYERAQRARIAALEAYGKWYMGQERKKTLQNVLQLLPVTLTKTKFINRLNESNLITTKYTFASTKDAGETIFRELYANGSSIEFVASLGGDVVGDIPLGGFETMISHALFLNGVTEEIQKRIISSEVAEYFDYGYAKGIGVVIITETNTASGGYLGLSQISTTSVCEWTPYLHILSDLDYQW